MGFATPMPEPSALQAYNAHYFDAAHGGLPADKASLGFHSGINRLRVAHVERFLADTRAQVSSVLEVGPGAGFFARHWLARHVGTSYVAIESDRSVHATLRAMGISVYANHAALPRSTEVDLLVLSHVLEHATDPIAFLTPFVQVLRPGGSVFIEVPCRDWEHKELDEPHLLFFDKGPMIRLLEKCGIGHVQTTYHGREIAELRKRQFVRRVREAVRLRLIARGIVAPFARVEPGLEVVESRLDRAALRPFEAHREQASPAWWLRAVGLRT
jgi:SAM-dependent methyltransferase